MLVSLFYSGETQRRLSHLCSITSERGQSQVVNPGSLASEPTAQGTQQHSTGAQGTWKLPVTFYTRGVRIGPRDGGGGEGVWEPGWVGPLHPERLYLFLLLNCSRNCAFIKCDSHPSRLPSRCHHLQFACRNPRTGMAALLGAGFPTRQRAAFILVEFVRHSV